MVKGWGELRSLAPFSWDTRVDDHPPGEAAMRDFSDAYSFAKSAERPRRSNGHYAQTPTPLTKSKRRSASASKDKENTHTPNAAYVSSRLGIASPAVHTPHTHAAQPSSVADQAVAQAASSLDVSDALSTPSAFTRLTPHVVNNSHSTPTSVAASAIPSAEAVLPIRALGERAHSRLGAPHSSALQSCGTQHNLPEQQHDKEPQAEVLHATTAVQERANHARICDMTAASETSVRELGAASLDAEVSPIAADLSAAQLLDHKEANAMQASLAKTRQLAPAGPARDPALAFHEPCQPTATAIHADAAPMELDAQTLPPAQAALVMDAQQADQQAEMHVKPKLDRSIAQAAEPLTWLTDAATETVPMVAMQTAQEQQLGCPVVPSAIATEQVHDPTMRQQDMLVQPGAHVASSQVQDVLSQGALLHSTAQLAHSDRAQPLEDEEIAPGVFLPIAASKVAQQEQHQRHHQQHTSSRAAGEHRSIQQGSERQALVPAAAGKSSRRAARDRSPTGTRMSLRSRDPGPVKKSRKVSSGRHDRVRVVSGARAPAYATRSHGTALSESEGSQLRQAPEHRSRRRHTSGSSSRRRPTNMASNETSFAARATSSDLAAAEALAELQHEPDSDDGSMASGKEAGQVAGKKKQRDGSGGIGYDRGFRVTAPPLPLWVAGEPSANDTPKPTDLKTYPPLFKPAAGGSAADDWCIGTSTPALQVLPRHRQSAAAAAEAMQTNPSPLSGLHKLALSICARKRGTTLQPCTQLGGAPGSGNHDKENVTPAHRPCVHTDSLAETAQVQASQMKTQQSWDQYVATQLSSAKDSTSQTKLVLTLEAELAQPGLGMLARACLLLRLEDAKAGLLYSQYRGILAACTAVH